MDEKSPPGRRSSKGLFISSQLQNPHPSRLYNAARWLRRSNSSVAERDSPAMFWRLDGSSAITSLNFRKFIVPVLLEGTSDVEPSFQHNCRTANADQNQPLTVQLTLTSCETMSFMPEFHHYGVFSIRCLSVPFGRFCRKCARTKPPCLAASTPKCLRNCERI